MRRVAIVTPTLTAADAVSNDVLTMRGVLSARGHDVRIFAESSSLAGEEVDGPAVALSHVTNSDDVLIYHHSIGCPMGVWVLTEARCRKIVRYHNVTPPEFFAGISEKHRRMCADGQAELNKIVASRPDLYLAASGFNRSDLINAGSADEKTCVLPPFNHADELCAGEADFELLDNYRDDTVNLLAVGGVRPNKAHADLVDAFANYYFHFNGNARLFIVGPQNADFQLYMKTVQEVIDSWSIDSCIFFTGAVSNESLKSYYLLADALLMTSEHEGFCVPLVEAMALKVPIVAYGSTAIPETAENAAIIWNQRDPYLMAQAIDRLQTDEAAKMAIVYSGSRRYEEKYSNRAIERQLIAVTTAAGFAF